jgi:hypothetical protein
MAKTKANERECVGQAIAWAKKQIAEGELPFADATNDSSLYGLPKVQFPDVLEFRLRSILDAAGE